MKHDMRRDDEGEDDDDDDGDGNKVSAYHVGEYEYVRLCVSK